MSSPRPDYDTLEPYLKTVFSLLEGVATVEEAGLQLDAYLRRVRERRLDPKWEAFLKELLGEKQRKESA